tara:strand:+ start:1679 stop:3199 length:1521 start_codon:yes stop_codon:yes gene_type:complete
MAKTKIHGEYLDPSVISGQTQVTAVGADSMLIFDATDNALKKALLSDLIETVGSTPTFSQISATSDLTLDVGGDIVLDAAGQQIIFATGGTNVGQIDMQGTDLEIKSLVNNADLFIRGTDGGSEITAVTFDMSEAGAATFNAGVTATSFDASAGFLNGSNGGIRIHSGGTKFFNITAANAARDNHMDIGASDARFKDLYIGGAVKNSSTVSLDAGNAEIHFLSSGTTFGKTYVSSGDFYFNNPTQDKDIVFAGDDGGSSVEGLRIDMSVGGQIQATSLGVSTPTFSFNNDTDTGITRPTGDTVQIITGGTEALRVNASQQLLVGTTSALQSDNKVSIAGSATGAGSGVIDIRNTSSNDNCGVISLSKATTTTTNANRYIYFYASNFGTNMGAIAANGTGNVAFVATSDERLKENIKPITGSLDKILALNPVSFDWKANGEHTKAGFVAQEVESVLPEYVATDEDKDKTKGLTGGMTGGYIAVLTKALQEANDKITALEARVKTLEG